jgi:cobalt-zinc-cadmium efflux system protein
LQGVPRGFDLKAIRSAISEVPGVTGVHDLHLWSVAGDDASLTAHVSIIEEAEAEATRRALVLMLANQFEIYHVTIQIEVLPTDDVAMSHR